MKTNNSNVAHIWAQQNESGRIEGSNFFAVGTSIYSYGSHFQIARFIDKKTVLFTTKGYSPTTLKHISHTNRALDGLDVTVFNVPDLGVGSTSCNDNLADYLHRINMLLLKHSRARVYDYTYEITHLLNEARAFITYFKMGRTSQARRINKIDLDDLEGVTNEIKKRRNEALVKERVKLNAQFNERINKFKGTEDVSYKVGFDYLKIDGDIIRTSGGAQVPLNTAIVAHKRLLSGKGVNGLQVGHFTIISHSETTIKIGCHNILISDLNNVLRGA